MTAHPRRTTHPSAAPGWLRHFIVLFLAATTALPLSAGPRPDIKGHVVSIHDGDTLTLLTPEKKQIKIRLEGIDAPELKQAFGTKATLSALVFDKDVVVNDKGTDRYRRTLGRIHCGRLDVNLAMVQRGMAWRYDKYSQEPALVVAQAEATKAARGLWNDKLPRAPWEWRGAPKSPAP